MLQDTRNLLLTWDKFKLRIQQDFKKAEKFFVKAEKSEVDHLNQEINKVKHIFGLYPSSEELREKLKNLKIKLKKVKTNSVEGILLRTHYKDLETDRFGVASAKCMQRNSFIDRTITNITSETGILIDDIGRYPE